MAVDSWLSLMFQDECSDRAEENCLLTWVWKDRPETQKHRYTEPLVLQILKKILRVNGSSGPFIWETNMEALNQFLNLKDKTDLCKLYLISKSESKFAAIMWSFLKTPWVVELSVLDMAEVGNKRDQTFLSSIWWFIITSMSPLTYVSVLCKTLDKYSSLTLRLFWSILLEEPCVILLFLKTK